MIKFQNLKIIVPIFLITIIAVSNKISSVFSGINIHTYEFASSNSDFSYFCVPAKGRSIEMMLRSKAQYDLENGTNTIICRRYPKSYLKFWRWREYWDNPYYKFPACK